MILGIDGNPTGRLALQESVTLMRGEPGSQIRLQILRSGQEAPLDITLTREIIRTESVRSEMLEPGYGYLRVSQFQSRSGEQVNNAIRRMERDGPLQGLVPDLGNHPGGVLPRAGARAQPKHLWPEVKSVIVLTLNYGPSHDPLEILARPDPGAVSVYAQGRDYHDIVKKGPKAAGGGAVGREGCDAKGVAGSARVAGQARGGAWLRPAPTWTRASDRPRASPVPTPRPRRSARRPRGRWPWWIPVSVCNIPLSSSTRPR